MPLVRIPAPLRSMTDGAAVVEVAGASVGDVVIALDVAHPGLVARLLDDHGELHRFVNVFVGDRDIRSAEGLDTGVGPDDTITIVPAVAGG